jgi:subtilisin family serine protease
LKVWVYIHRVMWKPRLGLFASLVIVIGALGFGQPVAASPRFHAALTNNAPVGFIVHLRAGASIFGSDGRVLGASALAPMGVELRNGKALGAGFHSIEFTGPVTESNAQTAVALIRRTKSVTSAAIDRFVLPQIFAHRAPSAMGQPFIGDGTASQTRTYSTAFKGASAVRGVKVTDAWSAKNPSLAQLKISWTKPLNLNGAALSGYRIQTSSDNGVTPTTLASVITAKQTSFSITQGLTAGSPLSVRVAALTKVGNAVRIGTYSTWVAGAPTTVPIPPTFNTPPTATNAAMPSWDLLTGADTGGLPVIYTLTASAPGQPVVSCSTKLNTCALVGLAQGIVYSTTLKAENARGSVFGVTGFSAKDPLYSKQWALNSAYGIQVESAWQHTHGNNNVTVAVVDSGITSHPDLDGQEWRNIDGSVYGYDFIDNDPNPSDPNSLSDWHGTHVSGIIAAAANNIGVVGVAPGVKLLEVRGLSGSGGTSSGLIASLNWAAGIDVPNVPKNMHPAQVINLSLGSEGITRCDSLTQAVMKNLYALNVTVITAAGNEGLKPWGDATNSYPGNCSPTINVGSTGFTGDRANYSDYGLYVDISAPGGDADKPGSAPVDQTRLGDGTGMILSTYNSGAPAANSSTPAGPADAVYDYLEGTSMAAPMVTGVVALIYSVKPTVTPHQIFFDLLKPSVTAFPDGSDCALAAANNSAMTCGAGILNAGNALNLLVKLP